MSSLRGKELKWRPFCWLPQALIGQHEQSNTCFIICTILQAVTKKSFTKLLKKPIKWNTPGVCRLKSGRLPEYHVATFSSSVVLTLTWMPHSRDAIKHNILHVVTFKKPLLRWFLLPSFWDYNLEACQETYAMWGTKQTCPSFKVLGFELDLSNRPRHCASPRLKSHLDYMAR